MNLAIEYLLKKDRIHSMLTLPTSLFLTNKDKKLVITLTNSYGQCGIIVKHWRLWEADKDSRLPPFTEYKTNLNQIFSDPNVIVKEFNIMDYREEPFETGAKQSTDYPQSQAQENLYSECIENMYNSKMHQAERQEWLWQAFEGIYVPDELKLPAKSELGSHLQRELVQFYSKPLWFTWQYWRKHLLDFRGTAAELVFRRQYIKKEPENKSYVMWPTSDAACIYFT